MHTLTHTVCNCLYVSVCGWIDRQTTKTSLSIQQYYSQTVYVCPMTDRHFHNHVFGSEVI